MAGVSAPADIPAAPQVSNPLPPLSTAVPVATSHPPAPVPAPATIASPSTTPSVVTAAAPLHVTVTSGAAAPASASAPSAAGAPAESTPGPSAAEVRRQHAAQQTRRLRRAVLRMEGCLASLPARQHDYLTLRAGLGRGHPLARAAAAKRVGLPRSRARAFERRALRALKGVCSAGAGAPSGSGAAHTSFAVAVARTTSGLRTARVEPVAERTQGEHQVLGVRESHRQPQQGGEGKSKVAPSVIGRTTGAIPRPPAGNSPSELWIVAALAALAALAGAALVRRRASRFDFAVALPPEAAAGAAGAGAAVTAAPPADPSQQLVSDALAALSWGDVEGAAERVHPDVRWPDPGNGTIEGRDQFEEYWNRRLAAVSIDIEPVSFERRNGELLVEVNEIVRSRMTHTMIGEYHAVRRFSFRDGLIAEMKHGRA